jgi:hypothetical protein
MAGNTVPPNTCPNPYGAGTVGIQGLQESDMAETAGADAQVSVADVEGLFLASDLTPSGELDVMVGGSIISLMSIV